MTKHSFRVVNLRAREAFLLLRCLYLLVAVAIYTHEMEGSLVAACVPALLGCLLLVGERMARTEAPLGKLSLFLMILYRALGRGLAWGAEFIGFYALPASLVFAFLLPYWAGVRPDEPLGGLVYLYYLISHWLHTRDYFTYLVSALSTVLPPPVCPFHEVGWFGGLLLLGYGRGRGKGGKVKDKPHIPHSKANSTLSFKLETKLCNCNLPDWVGWVRLAVNCAALVLLILLFFFK